MSLEGALFGFFATAVVLAVAFLNGKGGGDDDSL